MSAGEPQAIMVSEEALSNGHAPSETTPLLRNGDPGDEALCSSPTRQIPEDGPEVEEPTVREILVKLGSSWVGVFFAALGQLIDWSKSSCCSRF
jgi:hypothetical protein